MAIYFISSLSATAISILFLHDLMVFNASSAIPIALIVISLLQSVVFSSISKQKFDPTNATSYSLSEVDYKKATTAMKYHSLVKLAIVPLMCPFIIYFNGIVKAVASLCIYILSYLAVRPLINKFENK